VDQGSLVPVRWDVTPRTEPSEEDGGGTGVGDQGEGATVVLESSSFRMPPSVPDPDPGATERARTQSVTSGLEPILVPEILEKDSLVPVVARTNTPLPTVPEPFSQTSYQDTEPDPSLEKVMVPDPSSSQKMRSVLNPNANPNSLYFLVISVILVPLSCGSLIKSKGHEDDSLVLVAMSCATLLEAVSYVLYEGKDHRRFVRSLR